MWRPHWRGAGDSQLPRPPDVATSESNSLLNPIYTDLWRNDSAVSSSESKILAPTNKRRRRDQERRSSNPYRRSSGPACGCAGLQRRGRRRSPVRNSGSSLRRRRKRKRNLRLELGREWAWARRRAHERPSREVMGCEIKQSGALLAQGKNSFFFAKENICFLGLPFRLEGDLLISSLQILANIII